MVMVTGLSEVLSLFREQEHNRNWFEDNRERVVGKHPGNFMDLDGDVGRLMHRMEKKYPPDRMSVE